MTSHKEKADFVITGASDTKKAGWAKIVFMGNLHSDEEASVAMVNNKTGTVVFAYAVNKKNTLHGQQTSAEACAKHLILLTVASSSLLFGDLPDDLQTGTLLEVMNYDEYEVILARSRRSQRSFLAAWSRRPY